MACDVTIMAGRDVAMFSVTQLAQWPRTPRHRPAPSLGVVSPCGTYQPFLM
jgi:hypothetical protein